MNATRHQIRQQDARFGRADHQGLGLVMCGIGVATMALFAVVIVRAGPVATLVHAGATAAPVRAPIVLAAPPENWGLTIHGGPLDDVNVAESGPASTAHAPSLRSAGTVLADAARP